MPSSEVINIGYVLVKDVWKQETIIGRFLDELEDKFKYFLRGVDRKVSSIYDEVFDSLSLSEDGIVENTIENISLVSLLMERIEGLQFYIKPRLFQIISEGRYELFSNIRDREQNIMHLLSSIGISDDRIFLTDENEAIQENLRNNVPRWVGSTFKKWLDFAYDTFYLGISRGFNLSQFKELFYNKDGSIKIGSSLVGEVVVQTLAQLMVEKASYAMRRAKELEYYYCWNANPMDMRTKTECLEACFSGVITESQMASEHGFPPRYTCRCSIVYVRPEWTGINQGINIALEERRVKLVNEYTEAPRQKSQWLHWGRVPVYATDPIRAVGLKYYAHIKKKKKVAERNKVPDWTVPEEARKEAKEFEDFIDAEIVRSIVLGALSQYGNTNTALLPDNRTIKLLDYEV